MPAPTYEELRELHKAAENELRERNAAQIKDNFDAERRQLEAGKTEYPDKANLYEAKIKEANTQEQNYLEANNNARDRAIGQAAVLFAQNALDDRQKLQSAERIEIDALRASAVALEKERQEDERRKLEAQILFRQQDRVERDHERNGPGGPR